MVVVGAGIAGLAAALELGRRRPDVRVVVVEAADRVGGKVHTSEVGGLAVDEGADAMLRRVPEGVALAAAAGLELTTPTTGAAGVLVDGALRALPTGTILGVPGDLAALAASGLLSRTGLARVFRDADLPGEPVTADISVGELVTRRLGREVVERLVDPLLGGVYAGRADNLSLQATLPQLAGPARRHTSLLAAAEQARVVPAPGTVPEPVPGAVPGTVPGAVPGTVFASVAGGLGTLPAALARVSGAQVRLATTVRGLSRTPTGWRLETGSAAAPGFLDADAVILTLPAAPAARLLAGLVPAAAAELAGLEYASVALITLVLDMPTPGVGSGYLVPATEGLATKAMTYASRKWPRLAGGPAVVRASVGRHGEEAVLQRGDAELVAIVAAELAGVVGPLGPLVDSRVTRWGGALPQYTVGHLDRVARIKRAVAAHPGLAVAGAAYDGVGVPAVAASGQQAARVVLAGLPAAVPPAPGEATAILGP